MQEKAYKLLALQENISNREAKDLIDRGLVFSHGKKVVVARALMSEKAKFSLVKTKKPKVLFEDEKILAINKPYSYISEELESEFGAKLLNRLDKETSGLILLCKDEDFRQICIGEFKKQRVYKSYIAVLDGVLAEELVVNEPIRTIKGKNGAFSKISKDGQSALSTISPLMIQGKKTLAKICIQTGRTHQIRVHTAFIKHPIMGDEKYGKNSADRMYLHSYELKILHYEFKASLDESFAKFGFEVKNLEF
ncbi:pseudouridine synthase family protein [Campylobacter helveticus]|uniref:RNA pseudouridylate synthase n=1 Tax=Campylobacter helveticus TaxID=28898 RepID=A0AAX2ULB8_9BACT|nr:RluA family pseudouridine synthase [Campylobacter helveticus]ARE80762.1 23S rRNA and tRNA pseudouridine synthase [Campylobacter helveticus]MCR2039417.1 RluA family pseudouridine synthase [Campylobacter helveticus]MCR2055167.1 RluA family pseudouridine synthase [Campylobacter helveticus]MCR2060731.1 RluA family pseudouridine synthase [Campylobacter helveticus]MCR2062872.1 RluA family pseudouridine synthase [Campylobacter helveticus]